LYKLLNYFDKFSDVYVIPSNLVREFSRFSAVELANALTELEKSVVIFRKYKVKTTDGKLLNYVWDDPRQIPEYLYDDGKVLSTAPMDVVPVFKKQQWY